MWKDRSDADYVKACTRLVVEGKAPAAGRRRPGRILCLPTCVC